MRFTNLRLTLVFGAFVICAFASAPWLLAEPIASEDSSEPSSSSELKNPQIVEAVARFQNHDIVGALNLLKEAASKDSDLPPAQVIIAQLFAQTNSLANAHDYLEKAVIEVPDDPEAYLVLADMAMRGRRITEADLLYQKAASLTDKFDKSKKRKESFLLAIYSGLASVAESRENWSEAQKQLEALLSVDSQNAAVLRRIARCLFQQKNIEAALDKFREVAKIDLDAYLPEVMLAQLYQQAGDHENAKKWLTTALAASPKDIRTHLIAVQWALQTDQLDEALAESELALKLDPKSLDAKIYRGLIALFQKDYKNAEMYFESACLQSPSSFLASNGLALTLVEQKDEAKKRKALEYAEVNAKRFSKLPDATATYGWVLYKLGRLDEAEQALRFVVSNANGLTPDTAYYLARVSVDRGREAEAKQLLEGTLKANKMFLRQQEAQALLQQLQK